MAELMVSGACQVTFNGAALGYSVDGVRYSLIPTYEDVHVDLFGPAPYDVQKFPGTARVTAELIYFDNGAIDTALAAAVNGVVSGTLLGAGGVLAALVLSGTGGKTFPKAYLEGSQDTKIGTRVTRRTLSWRCLPYTGTATGTGGSVVT